MCPDAYGKCSYDHAENNLYSTVYGLPGDKIGIQNPYASLSLLMKRRQILTCF